MEGLEIFDRSTRLLGSDVMDALGSVRVIIFGVGGVGSWCAEGLVRSGIRHLTIVDADRVGITNVNRQLQATTSTVGRVKVEVLRERLLDINPSAEIIALEKVYTEESCAEFNLDSYDYIIDAIDSLKDKVSLILRACETSAKFYSSMGAALKLDPTKIRVAEFWQVQGCPLGAMLRRRMRKAKTFPAKKFTCIYDEEVLENRGSGVVADDPVSASLEDGSVWAPKRAQINGTTAHVTAIFGMTISGLIVQDVYKSVVGR